jgi:phosphopantothenoylcysteine synthetase/decarboxylase
MLLAVLFNGGLTVKLVITAGGTSEKIDAIIHSMAVSDYAVRSVTTARALATEVAEKIMAERDSKNMCRENLKKYVEAMLWEKSALETAQKIPSDIDDLIITLRRTPKIISMFKALQPETLLVGFKLLSGVPEETLLKTGFETIKKTDAILCSPMMPEA